MLLGSGRPEGPLSSSAVQTSGLLTASFPLFPIAGHGVVAHCLARVRRELEVDRSTTERNWTAQASPSRLGCCLKIVPCPVRAKDLLVDGTARTSMGPGRQASLRRRSPARRGPSAQGALGHCRLATTRFTRRSTPQRLRQAARSRNVAIHGHEVSEPEALDQLAVVSFLGRWIDE